MLCRSISTQSQSNVQGDVGGCRVTRRQLESYVPYMNTDDGTLWDWSGEGFTVLGQVDSSEGHVVIYPKREYLKNMPKHYKKVEGMKLAISAFPLEYGYDTWEYVYIPEDVESSDVFIMTLDNLMARIYEESGKEGFSYVAVLPLGEFSYHDGGLQYDSGGYYDRDGFFKAFG